MNRGSLYWNKLVISSVINFCSADVITNVIFIAVPYVLSADCDTENTGTIKYFIATAVQNKLFGLNLKNDACRCHVVGDGYAFVSIDTTDSKTVEYFKHNFKQLTV